MENQELENVQDTATPTEEQAPQLTIADLQNIRNLIDVAVRRGAFGAQETTAVGSVFDRLNVFLNAVAPAVEQAPAADQAPATTEETAA
jgi:hypothetical protein